MKMMKHFNRRWRRWSGDSAGSGAQRASSLPSHNRAEELQRCEEFPEDTPPSWPSSASSRTFFSQSSSS
ncbi:hypothetical protein EYF80_023351 [Liparis tanakae]|uniref:Uncharacterized protein n=1 Tax=Liparis tanakae TaxID=230148 RepID=A0A4Z2HNA2_9TELE|nr:hypothetical protein EYF80_023351 [Liparis tanakae]